MQKKGFIRTMEAFLAIVFTFAFLLVIVPANTPSGSTENIHILLNFEQNNQFRQCAIAQNTTCVENLITGQLPGIYEYTLLITSDANAVPTLPVQQTFSESLYLVGNNTAHAPTIVKLFYWRPVTQSS